MLRRVLHARLLLRLYYSHVSELRDISSTLLRIRTRTDPQNLRLARSVHTKSTIYTEFPFWGKEK